jgi:hypothetical protein
MNGVKLTMFSPVVKIRVTGRSTAPYGEKRVHTHVSPLEVCDMGFLDKLKKSADDVEEKASELVSDHSDKLHEGIEKTADFADEKTKGKYSDKIEKVEKAASDLVDKVASGEPPTPSNEVDDADAPDDEASEDDDTPAA